MIEQESKIKQNPVLTSTKPSTISNKTIGGSFTNSYQNTKPVPSILQDSSQSDNVYT